MQERTVREMSYRVVFSQGFRIYFFIYSAAFFSLAPTKPLLFCSVWSDRANPRLPHPPCILRKLATFPSIFLSCRLCALAGHTLLHSWSASNNSTATPSPPSPLSVDPLIDSHRRRLCSLWKSLRRRCSLRQSFLFIKEEKTTEKKNPTSNIWYHFLFSHPFIWSQKRRCKRSWMPALFLSNSPTSLHSFHSPFRGGMATERWQPVQEFYREHSRTT